MSVSREQYGVLYPRFWEGTTGRQIQKKGKDAIILAAYLLSCRHANMIGLFEMPLEVIERELQVFQKKPSALLAAFVDLADVGYCEYDLTTEYVWVREMARIRLYLDHGDTLHQDDKRHKAVVKLYVSLRPNPFVGRFFDHYKQTLKLTKKREDVTLHVAPSKGLPSPDDGPQKGLRRGRQASTGTSTSTGASTSAGSGADSIRAAASPLDHPVDSCGNVENPDENVSVITALILKEVFPLLGPKADDGELAETTKLLCAKGKIAYNSEAVAKAIRNARFLDKNKQLKVGAA